MLSGEISGIHYLTTPEIQVPNPANFGNIIMQDNIPSSFHFNGASVFSNLLHTQIPPPGHDQLLATPVQSSSLSNNSSTSDEAEEHVQQLGNIIDQRKQRRMISNRESARRSRMRKQKHLDELWSQVLRLRTENHNLMDRLNHVSETHDRVLEENAKLKEEASDLRQMLSEIQISTLRSTELEVEACSTTLSTDLLR
ncbi:putative transcription factor bZIP family [Rosa chinensis]|uniref:Putative transcription factor bZIP family n=1 Tax=Rosa chinensis TaxID=74649 RepID=A0A2P6R258_ROSCH|nr:basic leucine zipper 43 [Rosa chinensis]PRQ40521.1 putative transcription factor bZIP family [Rosa chinensis]